MLAAPALNPSLVSHYSEFTGCYCMDLCIHMGLNYWDSASKMSNTLRYENIKQP